MKQNKKTKCILVILLLLTTSLVLISNTATAAISHHIFGYAKDNTGQPIKDGIIVTAIIVSTINSSIRHTQNTTIDNSLHYGNYDFDVLEAPHFDFNGGQIYFYIGNENTTNTTTFSHLGTTNLSLTIDDIPQITDNSPGTGYAGASFTFNVTVVDYVDTADDLKVNISWAHEGLSDNTTLTPAGGDYFEGSVTLDNSIATMTYIIWANDSSGNMNFSGPHTVTVNLSEHPVVYVYADAHPSWYNSTQVRTIQEGITNVTQGGMVYVWNGTYYGTVTINKNITVQANSSALLDAEGGHGIVIEVSNVTIENLIIDNATGTASIFGSISILAQNQTNPSAVLENIMLSNLTITDTDIGIWFGYGWGVGSNVTSSTVFNCHISNGTDTGIALINSDNCTVSYSTVFNMTGTKEETGYGIFLYNSDNCTISNSTITYVNSTTNEAGFGIFLQESSHNTIENNTVSYATEIGIFFMSSNNNTISGNTIVNTTNATGGTGVFLFSLENNTMLNNLITNNPIGIYLFDVTHSDISLCNISYNHDIGIVLWNTTYCTISNNQINGTIDASGGPTGSAMILFTSNDNIISENYLCNNALEGIVSYLSTDNTIINNTLVNDGIRLTGSELSHYIHNIQNNTINDEPIRYYKDASNVFLDENNATGQIILVNSSHFELRNMTFDNTVMVDIFLAQSNNITISNCTISNSHESGIYLDINSEHNTISLNTIYNNLDGIYLIASSNNNIVSNHIFNNTDRGIRFINSDNNNITSNFVYNNTNYGFMFWTSSTNNISSNTIYNNKYGIDFSNSNNNIVFSNTLSNNEICGINLGSSDNTTISSNELYNNTLIGMRLYNCSDNNISLNTINNNAKGIWLNEHSSDNTIYNNYFDNTINAEDDGNNIYNITKALGTNIVGGPYLGGNYWSDYWGVDTEGDGLGNTNTPHNSSEGIQNGGDYHPLIAPPGAPTGFTATATSTSQINLAWTKGTNATHTRIQRKTGSYPTNISDGTNVYNGTGVSKSDTGLSAGTTYYYRAWSYNDTSNLWSSTYASKHTSTQSTTSPPPPPPPPPPATLTANAGGPYTGTAGTPVTLTGSATYGTAPYTYSWNFGDNTTGTGQTINHTYLLAGTYTATLTVTDNTASTATDTTTVTITAPTYAPVADAGGPYIGLTFANITFDASNSYDSDGTIVNYTWDLGDNTTAYGMIVTHQYNTEGFYNITLTVTDNDGLTNTTRTIALIALDSDRDGWSDEEETYYGTDPFDDSNYPVAINVNGIPGLLLDTNQDGIFDTFYNLLTNTRNLVIRLANGTYLLDVNDDGIWDYLYDPSAGTTTPYQEEEFPLMIVAIIGFIILIILIVIVILFKTGYLYIEKTSKKDQKKPEEKKGK